MKLLVLCSVLKNVLHVAGSGSAFNTLANAILILKVNGIHTVCKPLEPDVYDVPHCRLMCTQWGVFKINESLIGGTAYVVNYPISNNKTWIVLSAFHSGFEYIKIISKVYNRWESSCEITTNETIESNKNTSIFLFIIGNN